MRSRGLYEENHNGNLHHLTRRDPKAERSTRRKNEDAPLLDGHQYSPPFLKM